VAGAPALTGGGFFLCASNSTFPCAICLTVQSIVQSLGVEKIVLVHTIVSSPLEMPWDALAKVEKGETPWLAKRRESLP
jgi:hypothetical protein